MLRFSDSLLTLLVQLSPTSRLTEEVATTLRMAGVSGVVEALNAPARADEASSLPLLRSRPPTAALIEISGERCAWLRGDFVQLQSAADDLPPSTRWIASLPAGCASSSELLSQVAIDGWKLRTSGCSALVLPFDELAQAASADGDWYGVARHLMRMRRAVSAVDYPPTIFHIGEDELVTQPEVE